MAVELNSKYNAEFYKTDIWVSGRDQQKFLAETAYSKYQNF